jgi:YD repeat-containing protein
VSVGGSTANQSYDTAGRLSAFTFPGGATETLSYDPASNVIEEVTTTTTYQHDADGLLIGTTTDGPASLSPSLVASSTYNPDDELTKWGTAALGYDAIGNLVSDARTGNTYAWNGQIQLVGLSGASAETTTPRAYSTTPRSAASFPGTRAGSGAARTLTLALTTNPSICPTRSGLTDRPTS